MLADHGARVAAAEFPVQVATVIKMDITVLEMGVMVIAGWNIAVELVAAVVQI